MTYAELVSDVYSLEYAHVSNANADCSYIDGNYADYQAGWELLNYKWPNFESTYKKNLRKK